MTPDELKHFPNASRSCIARNQAGGAPPHSEPEPAVCNEPVAKAPGTGCDPCRIAVRITSYRRRLLDPDNLCAKYFIDGLRYALLIPDDREQDISLEVRQIRVKCKTSERTEIEIA